MLWSAALLAASKKNNGSGASFLILIAVLGLAMYFLFLRPQRARQRLAQQMRSALEPGAEVVTTSGLYATVHAVDEEQGTVELEVAPGVVSRFAKGAIARVIEPDHYESIDEPPATGSEPTPSSGTTAEDTTVIETPPEGTPST